jgi:hypothetical protein
MMNNYNRTKEIIHDCKVELATAIGSTLFTAIFMLLISTSASAQTADTYLHAGGEVRQFNEEPTSVWGNSTNDGSWGSEEQGQTLFYGVAWKNENSADMPGAGTFNFKQPRPAPYANNVAQTLEGGHDWSTDAGCSFPDIRLDNANNLFLVNDDSKVRDTFEFVDGHVIHDKMDFTVGDSDPGEILGYNETQFFVTNGDPADTEGFLQRENVAAADAEEAFPVGHSVGDYTPGSIGNTGTVDDYSIRVFLSTYVNGTLGSTFNDSTVQRTWDVEERVTGGSDVTLALQHNTATEGALFASNKAKHYITHYVGATPNGPSNGNGVTAISSFTWDLMAEVDQYAGESGDGYITTGASISSALVTKRSGLSLFSPYTKTFDFLEDCSSEAPVISLK